MIGLKKEFKTAFVASIATKQLADIKASISKEKELAKNRVRAREILTRLANSQGLKSSVLP